jgi:hypothetical protein
VKKIKYNILQSLIADKEEGASTPILLEAEMPWSEAAEEIAKAEAYNGGYTIFDDGEPEPVAEASTDDILNALLGVTE